MRRFSLAVGLLLLAITVLSLSPRLEMQSAGPAAGGRETIGDREVAARELLVKFTSVGQADLRAIAAEIDAESVVPIGRAGAYRIRSRSLGAAALLRAMRNNPRVAYAEPNFIVRAFTQPNDVSFPSLWGLLNTGQAVNGGLAGTPNADIHATSAWDLSVGSTATVVAVVDTGVDYTHQDLSANMWSAPAAFTVSMGGSTVRCQAGTHGFNVINKSCDPMDDNLHGTHVSGTIGAAGNNGLGVVGVNWIASIMGIKFIGADGSGTIADAVDALDLAIQTKQAFGSGANVRVLSNSWGGSDFSQALLDEINATNDSDMLFTAAAGNSAFSNDIIPTYPASFDAPNIIAVAATTNTDALAWFSNYGANSVHLGAPGMDILSTVPGNDYAFESGTSMATPHVSGAAALVLSRCDLSTGDLMGILLNSVEQVPALASTTITGGRLDVNSAVHACTAPPTTPTGLTATGGDGKVTLKWTAVAGATGYTVKRSLTAGGPYAAIAQSVRVATYVDSAVTNDTTYYYVVSATNGLGESGDSNEAHATPRAPSDLVISALTVPTTGGAGKSVTVSVTTTNQGTGAADPTTTRFYLSPNAMLDTSDAEVGAASVPALAPGASSSASVSLAIPSNTATASYYVFAKADADAVMAESQETNNTAIRLLQIGPDLVISSSTVPQMAGQGATISVTETVTNQGGGDAGSSATAFYLSGNVLLDTSDVRLTGSRAVAALAAGASSTGTTTLTIPTTVVTGTYYLLAVADGDHAVAETQEGNNVLARVLKIGGDLTVSAFSVPSKGAAGAAITVTDTTTNSGAGPIGASVTRFYVSSNAILDAGDTLLDGGRQVPELAAGTSSTGNTTLTLPAGIVAGTYYLFAKADADNAVPETQESNNTSVRSIQIGGDLVISALTVPSKAAAGQTVAVTDTTTNQGAGAIAASTTRFYLSTNAVFDAGDTQLTGGRGVPNLDAGASSTGSTNVTLPASLVPGNYYLFAKADGDNAVPETNESNNATGRLISIGPDLTVSAYTVPSSMQAGSTVTVSDTIKNQGVSSAGGSTTTYYLSLNITLDANDVAVGSRSVDPIDGGSSNTGSTVLTIPAGMAPGTYVLIIKADSENAVAESNEGNNVALRYVQVTAGS